jgi:mRNA interferase MazF
VRRGDVITVAERRLGAPRPAVVVGTDVLSGLSTVLICPLTTHHREALLYRVPVRDWARSGLQGYSEIMVERLTFVERGRCGPLIGRLPDETARELDRALGYVLALGAGA